MEKPTIYWIRRDLRVDDNPALDWAANCGGPVLPVYIHAPDEEGDWAPGAASRWWLHEALADLAASFRELGSPLVIRRGSSLDTLVDLIDEVDAAAVVWNRLYEPAIVERDRSIKEALKEREIKVRSLQANVLFEPWTVSTNDDKPYRVYTPYRKNVEDRPEPADPLASPSKLDAPEPNIESLQIDQLELLPKIKWYESLAEHWDVTEAAAHECLELFNDDALSRYNNDRDRPDRPGTSRLSPYLHFGQISPRRVWRSGDDAPANKSRWRFRSELLWREFAHHLLWHFPKSPTTNFYEKFDAYPWNEDEEAEAFRAWTRGETGIELVDAGMRQLWHTGWMHNRVRMVVASLLTKNLGFHWRLGARWFWDTLVDADLASNTLGWQWAAGSGADAAPFFRIFNPDTQAEKFDPNGAYRDRWLGEKRAEPIVDLKASRREALDAYEAVKNA